MNYSNHMVNGSLQLTFHRCGIFFSYTSYFAFPLFIVQMRFLGIKPMTLIVNTIIYNLRDFLHLP